MVTKRGRVQIDPSGLARGQLDTFKAQRVPFKGVPRVTGIGENYSRLAQALGGLGNSLGSLGATLASQEQKNQMEGRVWLEREKLLQNATPEARADAAATNTGVDTTSEYFKDITTLTTKTLPDAAIKEDERRKAESESPEAWTKKTEGEAIGVNGERETITEPMTDKDIEAKWGSWLAGRVGGYSNHYVYRPQIAALNDFVKQQMAADKKALRDHIMWKTETAARDAAVMTATGIAKEIDKRAPDASGASGDEILNGLSANGARIFNEARGGNDLKLSADQRTVLMKRQLEAIVEKARTDPEAARIVQKIATGRFKSGGLARNHPAYEGVIRSGLKIANDTLVDAEHNSRLEAVMKAARKERGNYGSYVDTDLVTGSPEGSGYDYKREAKRSEIIKQLAAQDEAAIFKEAVANKHSPEETTRRLITNAEERGYTSPYIENTFKDAMTPPANAENDPKAQEQYNNMLDTYRTLRRDAPNSINGYIKDGNKRNFLRALDIYNKTHPEVPAVVAAQRIQATLTETGSPRDALANRPEAQSFRKWVQDDATAKSLSPARLADVKAVYNMLYGDLAVSAVDDPHKALTEIAKGMLEGGIKQRGRVIDVPAGFVPAGISPAKFNEQIKEYTTDMLRRHVMKNKNDKSWWYFGEKPSETAYKDLDFYPLPDGNGYKVVRKNGTTVRLDDGRPFIVNFSEVEPYIRAKYAPVRDAEYQRRVNKARQVGLGEKPIDPPKEQPMDFYLDSPHP